MRPGEDHAAVEQNEGARVQQSTEGRRMRVELGEGNRRKARERGKWHLQVT